MYLEQTMPPIFEVLYGERRIIIVESSPSEVTFCATYAAYPRLRRRSFNCFLSW